MIDKFILMNKEGKHLYIQLYKYFKDCILSGEIKKGEKLPSIRMLAKELNISKITVEGAYSQLVAEGYIENIPRRGYFAIGLSEYVFDRKTAAQKIGEETFTYINTGVDKDSFDLSLWRKTYNSVIRDNSQALFDGGDLKGELILREEISDFIGKSRGVVCDPNRIVIGSGSQYLLGMIATLIKDENSSVIFEDPGFEQARYTFEDYGFGIKAVKVDGEGIKTDLLEKTNARVAYLSPSHQYPMGTVMPIKRRLEVLAWARKVDGLIIEDDYDSIFRYENEPIPSLQGLDEGRHVVYMGSFSKLLTPAMRISYMVLPDGLLSKYEKNKHRFTQTASKIEQLTLGRFMKEGHFERHLRKANKIYYKKNNLLIDRLKSRYGDKIEILGENSGLHLIIKFKDQKEESKLHSIFDKNNILFEKIKIPESEDSYILLTYSGLSSAQIEDIF
ncbi:PLP-dependent aminotransferase family protein [Alkalibacter sp. M17DMB]|nr:PLP-dependent aminotransferase family protein [Alkalibacter mobilis]